MVHSAAMALGSASYAVSIVSATPLAGLDRELGEIPAPVHTATDRDLETTGALDLSALLNRRLTNVYLNEIQGNPMQADLNYRGFTASPLLGTPQGLSVYMDGVRLNQPFGDVVSWDLISRSVISEMAMIPGSNPLFGLNTLGGALSVRTKDGVSHPGSSISVSGSFARTMADLEHGGSAGSVNWFLDAIAVGRSYARGNENNLHRPDGRYYLGEGMSPGYTVVNPGARWNVRRRVQLFAHVNNLLDGATTRRRS